MSNGKGDNPRNCLSKQFKSNYEEINWGKKVVDLKLEVSDNFTHANDIDRVSDEGRTAPPTTECR